MPRPPSEIALALFLAAAGCQEKGAPYDCTCNWLTDFDDVSTIEVRVCAASAARAPATAHDCAHPGAPVQDCSCRAAAGSCEVVGCLPVTSVDVR